MAAFDMDERKLERATAHLARRSFEDDKRAIGMVASLIAAPLLLALSAGLLLYELLSHL